jgi:hypothetical protein
MRVVLTTYRGLSHLMPDYMDRHEKYFNMPVTLSAEEDYSHGKYRFLKPPFGDTIRNGEFGPALKWTLENVKDKYIIIMLADYFINSNVDMTAIKKIAEYMTQEGDILRCEIGTNRGVGQLNEIDIHKGVSIREDKSWLATSLCPGIWDRKKLLKIIKGATAWDVELDMNREFQETDWRSIGVFPEPMDYENVIRARKIGEFINKKHFLLTKK